MGQPSWESPKPWLDASVSKTNALEKSGIANNGSLAIAPLSVPKGYCAFLVCLCKRPSTERDKSVPKKEI